MELQHLLGNLERAVEDKFAAARGGSEEILRIARPTFEALKLLILDFEGKVGQVTQSIAGHLVRAASGLELRPSDHQAIVKACELIAEHKSKAQFRLGEPGGPYLLVTGLDSCLAEIASYFERRMQEVEIPHAERTALVKWARSTISGFAIQYSTLVLGITLRVYELDRESLAKARALLERAGVVLPRIRTVTEMPGPSRPLIRDVGGAGAYGRMG